MPARPDPLKLPPLSSLTTTLDVELFAKLASFRRSGIEYSWSDELKSLGYVLLYLANGSLPWQGLNASTKKQKDDLIKEQKAATSVAALCDGLPREFAVYVEYTRLLEFNERRDYAYPRQLFRRLFVAKGLYVRQRF